MSVLRIDIESPHCSVCSYVFHQHRVLIGRSPRSHICVPDLRVSLEHLQIIWTDQGELEVLDLYSKSGVWGGVDSLKPGQAYRAYHHIMLRFLEYRLSVSISPRSLPASSMEDRTYHTTRLAQSESGWLLKHTFQGDIKVWALPSQTNHEWKSQHFTANFTVKSNGIHIVTEIHTTFIQPHLPWQSPWGEWSIFPLNKAAESSVPFLETRSILSSSVSSKRKNDSAYRTQYFQGLMWMIIGGIGLIGGIGSWIYFMM